MRRRLPTIRNPQSAIRNRRSGFTLLELVIVVMILIILALIAFPVLNAVNTEDKISGTSRSIRSFVRGARDRALHAKLPRGVRFLRDKNDPNVITGMVYIGPAGNLSVGTITISNDGNSRPRRVTPSNAAVWNRLRSRGLINPNGARLVAEGSTYTVIHNGTNWQLTKDYIGTAGNAVDYVLELGPDILPNQEPRRFPADVVIDLQNSQVPSTWRTPNAHLDVMFSPRGTVIGSTAAAGHIHLVVTSLVDVDQGRAPGDPNKEEPETIVTITTQTGSVSSHSVFSTGDPFRNAETGVETQ